MIEGNIWYIVSNSNGLFLVLDTAFEDLGGDWQIAECDDDRFEFTKNNQSMIIDQECEGDFECSVGQINTNILECGWELQTNLIASVVPMDVFFTPIGQVLASNKEPVNPLGTGGIVVIASNIFIEFTFQQGFEVLNGQWQFVECEDDELYLISGSNCIQLSKICIVNNQALLDCLSYYIVSQECDANNDAIASFVFEVNSSQTKECLELYTIVFSIHPAYENAVNNINLLYIPITTPLEFECQTIYFRVFSEVTQEYAVLRTRDWSREL